jgi:hypothetical protein
MTACPIHSTPIWIDTVKSRTELYLERADYFAFARIRLMCSALCRNMPFII